MLCDIDGTLAPIVAHARGRPSVPAHATTACWRSSRAATAWLPASPGRPRGGGAADGRARLAHLLRQPRARAARARRGQAGRRSAIACRWRERVRRFAAEHFTPRSASASASRSRTRTSIWAFHYRDVPDEEAAHDGAGAGRAGGGGRGPVSALGTQGARDPAHRARSTRAPRLPPRSTAAASRTRCTAATTRPTWTPSGKLRALVARRRSWRARSASGSRRRRVPREVDRRGGPGGARARTVISRSSRRWPPDKPRPLLYTDFLKSTVLLAAAEGTALAAVTILAAADAGRHDHDHLRARVVGRGRADRRLARPARGDDARHRAPAGRRAHVRTRCPRSGPERCCSTGCGCWPCRRSWRPALSWLFPQFAAVVAGGAFLVALAWRKQERGGDRDRGARRRALLRRAVRRLQRDRADAHPGTAPPDVGKRSHS